MNIKQSPFLLNSAIGVGVGAITATLCIVLYAVLASAVAQTNLFLGDGKEVLFDLLRYYVPSGAFVGGALAGVIAPIIRRRAHAVCVISIATLLTTPIALGAISTVYYWIDSRCCMRERDPAELHMAYANYSSSMVASVYFDGVGLGLEFPPIRNSNTEDAYLAGGVSTPFWRPSQRYEIRWSRYAPGALVATEVKAVARIPPYLGTRHKVFVIYFLPDDRVRIEAINLDPSESDVLLKRPPRDGYVVKGRVVG